MDDNLRAFLEQLQSSDGQVRYAAWRSAGPLGAAAVVPLADLMASPEKGVAKAAQEALKTVVHYAGRPGARAEARAVAAELLKVAASARPYRVRAEALNGLGFIGDRRVVPGLAKLLEDREVREEARLALERIPGPAALRALREALRTGPADFKAHLEQSLYNRHLKPDTVGTLPGPERSPAP
jgi:HEAT repeat protein